MSSTTAIEAERKTDNTLHIDFQSKLQHQTKCEMSQDLELLDSGINENSYNFEDCYQSAIKFVSKVYSSQLTSSSSSSSVESIQTLKTTTTTSTTVNTKQQLYIHITTATDQSIVRNVFDIVKSRIVQKNLNSFY